MGFFRLPNSKVFSKKSTKFAELVCAEKLAEATWALCQDVVKGIHHFWENLQFSKRFENVCFLQNVPSFLGDLYKYIYIWKSKSWWFFQVAEQKNVSVNFIGNPKNNPKQ